MIARLEISCVVIGRNEGAHLEAALRAAQQSLEESGVPGEVIYVDSASTDDSRSIASRVAGVRVLEVQDPASNAAAARNLGISVARGRYVQLLDGDMRVDAGWLRKAVTLLARRPGAALAGRLIETNARNTIWNRAFGQDWSRENGQAVVLGGAALWRREVLLELGGFDVALRVGEDPDLCLRARALHHELYQVDVPMATHDLDLRSWRDYLRRARAVGQSVANVAWRHPRSAFARGRFQRVLAWSIAAVLALGLCFVAWPWGFLAMSAAAGLLFLRRLLLDLVAGSSLRDAGVHAAHVYLVKLPVAWSALRQWQHMRRLRSSS